VEDRGGRLALITRRPRVAADVRRLVSDVPILNPGPGAVGGMIAAEGGAL